MPLLNDYNERIAKQVHDTLQRKVDHEKAYTGGNGYAMATHLDLGVGAPSLGIRSTYNKNDTGDKYGSGTVGGSFDWGQALGDVAHVAAHVAPLMMLAAGKPKEKKPRKKKMTGGVYSLGGTQILEGEAPPTAPKIITAPSASKEKEQIATTTNSDMPSKIGGKRPNKRAEIVRQVMQEKGLKLIEASKYVKEHNLYKPEKQNNNETEN